MQQDRPFWEIMIPVPFWPGASVNLVFAIALATFLFAGLSLLAVLIVVVVSRRRSEDAT